MLMAQQFTIAEKFSATKLADEVEGFARKAFNRDGQLAPMFHIVTPEGEQDVAGCCLNFDETAILALRMAVAKFNGVHIATVAEAWTAVYGKEDGRDSPSFVPPTMRKDREEAVVILVQSRDGSAPIHRVIPIIRPEDGQPYLGTVSERDYSATDSPLLDMFVPPEGINLVMEPADRPEGAMH